MMIRFKSLRYLKGDAPEEWDQGEVIEETEDAIFVSLGDDLFYENAKGQVLIQKDYKVGGEVWQVHKTDADPFPSNPHAHCVGGRANFIGNKLHLGTRQMYHGARPLDLFLPKKPFKRLITLIQPKFPEIVLPLR